MTNPNYEAMLAGEIYSASDPHFFALKEATTKAKAVFDLVPNDDIAARAQAGSAFFAKGSGPCLVLAPFTIQFGHVRIGEWSFVNYGATFLDSNWITLGNHVAVGPNVQFITDTHPTKPEERFLPPERPGGPPFRVMNYALPITIHDYAWIGAGAIIMPGVTVHEGAVVAAGAIVTRDVPARTIVAGYPARKLRHLDEE